MPAEVKLSFKPAGRKNQKHICLLWTRCVSSCLFCLLSLVHGFIGFILSSLATVFFCYYCSYISYLVTGIIVFFSLAEDKKKHGKINRFALENRVEIGRETKYLFLLLLKKTWQMGRCLLQFTVLASLLLKWSSDCVCHKVFAPHSDDDRAPWGTLRALCVCVWALYRLLGRKV